jgi:2-octaprenyl-6-methoxyphenol hydroxylase
MKTGSDPGKDATLNNYASQRESDQRNMALATDALARLFSNPLSLVSTGRNIGLLAADLLPGIRHGIARHAMGLKDAHTRLSRGLTIE